MEKLIVSGGKPLNGTVWASGSHDEYKGKIKEAGDKITFRWKMEGTDLPRCNIQLFSGSKQIGLKSVKALSKGNGMYEFTYLIPDTTTSCRLVFGSAKAITFHLTAPTVAIGGGK